MAGARSHASGKDDVDGLLRACAHGDAEAFAALYARTSRPLYGIALRIARRPELAEEVLHDAYVTVWTKASQRLAGGGSAFAWMVTIVRHRAIDRLRSAREEPGVLDAERLVDGQPSVEERALERARSRAIRRCMGALEASPRQAILLVYYRGLTQREVAARLDAPLGTVKSWVRRGLLRLRECLEQ